MPKPPTGRTLPAVARIVGLACWLSALALPVSADEPAVDYARDVKSVLSKNCYKCHGPDEQKSGLRLDTVAAATDGGYSGAALEPGKSATSLLIKAIRGGDDDVMAMPPEGDRLTADQIAAIARWIDAGAKAPADDAPAESNGRVKSDHWSFQPIARPAVPTVRHATAVHNPIDAFVLQRLEREGIEPSAEADRVTLIRRATLDLLGLPPTIAEVDAFLADKSADAYEKLVDRLLASPHYGERWGRHWLDLARYADSNGYTNDNPRTIWKYREWVIDAHNRDLPFDQFTVQQLAGDLLPEPSIDQLVATGFHRNTLQNDEGGTDPEEFRVEAVVDRVATTGTVYLGLTIGCARCHDHKFDPISQKDFFRVFAVLNGADEPTLPVPTPDQQRSQQDLAAQIAAATAQLAAHDQQTMSQRTAWEKDLAAAATPVEWTVLDPVEFASAGGATLEKLEDKSLRASGEPATNDVYTVTAVLPIPTVTAVRLEVLTDDTLPSRGPGRAGNGNFVLSEIAMAVTGASGGEPQRAAWKSARADHSQLKFPIEHLIDGDAKTGWAINTATGSMNVDRTAICTTQTDLAGDNSRLVVTLTHHHADASYALGRFRIAVTGASRETLQLSDALRAALTQPADKRNEEQQRLLLDEYTKTDPQRIKLTGAIAKLQEQSAKLNKSLPTTLVMRERAEPRTTHLLVRGEYLRNGPVVEPGVPSVLPPLPSELKRPTRLDLARWLVDPANPLTARVTVNRIWQQYFGRGLVETSNDFGTQGSAPSHPELLDWLAGEFIAQGWSMKSLHRLIVTSATYRQASTARPDLANVDADNILLARQKRLRVEAEVVRDLTLAASGLLSEKIGGPSVFPPQPDGVMALTRSVRVWPTSKGEDRYRRGMYTYYWRSTPHPFLKVLDAPDGNTTCTKRDRANTPLQALTLLNDEACIEAARALAARVLAEPNATDTSARIRFAFRLCLSRDPSDFERACLAELLADELARPNVSAPAENAAAATAEGRVLAAWTSVARALLNVDEFVTRE